MHPPSHTGIARRTFLKQSAAAAAPMILASRVPGAAGGTAPNERIRVAMIGTGRQVFYANLPLFLGSKEVEVVAVCDVDAWRVDQARKRVEKHYAHHKSGTWKGCTTHRDFREVLAREDVDAVMISTPDHWHAYMAVEAAKAGKDIALEKPISLTVAEGRAIAEAVKKHGRIFRTDTEVRGNRNFQRLCQVVRNGRIGKVRRVSAGVPRNRAPLKRAAAPPMPVPPDLDYELWLGNAPERPYTHQRVHFPKAGLDYSGKSAPGWLQITDYSLGVMLNWGTHIIDIVQWALDAEGTGPVEVECSAGFPGEEFLWDVPTRFEARYRYADGIELSYSDAGRPFVRIEGTDGWIENTWFQSTGFKASDPALLKWQPGPDEIRLPLLGEKTDFIESVRSRKETLVPAEAGHRTATICQIGYIAATLGRKLKWDPAAEKFAADDEANRLLTRPMRAPWRVEV